MSPGCPAFLLLCHVADMAEQELWVALWMGTALGCMGTALDLVCTETYSLLLQNRMLIAFGKWRPLSAPLCQFFCGLIWSKLAVYLPECLSSFHHGSCVNHGHSCSFCYLIQPVLKLGWCTRGNFSEIPISECIRNIFWCGIHILYKNSFTQCFSPGKL